MDNLESMEGLKKEFWSEDRLRLAVRYASAYAHRCPRVGAYACAEKAVRRVFGRWLETAGGGVDPLMLPVYLRLVAKVEGRLGLHRRRPFEPLPAVPSAARLPQRPMVAEAVAA